jgi:hypothetical protein
MSTLTHFHVVWLQRSGFSLGHPRDRGMAAKTKTNVTSPHR